MTWKNTIFNTAKRIPYYNIKIISIEKGLSVTFLFYYKNNGSMKLNQTNICNLFSYTISFLTVNIHSKCIVTILLFWNYELDTKLIIKIDRKNKTKRRCTYSSPSSHIPDVSLYLVQ